MGNIRVHELVRELRKSNREVTDRLRKLGKPARTNLQSLTLEEANQIRVSFGFKPVKEKVPKKKAAKKPERRRPGRLLRSQRLRSQRLRSPRRRRKRRSRQKLLKSPRRPGLK